MDKPILVASWAVAFAGGTVLLWVVVAVVVGVLLRTLGVLFPRLGMFGSVLSHVRGSGPRVALTFDDGPDPASTRRVLEILAEERCVATFFVVGEKVVAHPDVVREIVAQGHGLGLHGFHHDRLHALQPERFAARDILQVKAAIEAACGVRPRWFRPPLGHASPATFRAAVETGVEIVIWSARGLDGMRSAKPRSVLRRIERRLRPGAIVMLHDASEQGDFVPAGVSVLGDVIRAARSRGLTWVTLDELAGVEPSASDYEPQASPDESDESDKPDKSDESDKSEAPPGEPDGRGATGRVTTKRAPPT